MARNSVFVEHLRGIDLFAGLTKKDLERVAAAGTQVNVPSGTAVMKEGQIGHTALVLLKGSMDVRRNGRKVRDVSIGAILGEMALIDDQPRSATVTCTSDCEVFEIIGGQFRDVIDNVPTVRDHLLAAMAGRVRELDSRTL